MSVAHDGRRAVTLESIAPPARAAGLLETKELSPCNHA
jgi:hypothetical protein